MYKILSSTSSCIFNIYQFGVDISCFTVNSWKVCQKQKGTLLKTTTGINVFSRTSIAGLLLEIVTLKPLEPFFLPESPYNRVVEGVISDYFSKV